MGSIVDCVDNTGILKVKVIKVLGSGFMRHAKISDKIIVSIFKLNNKSVFFNDARRKIRFKVGSLHKGIVVHTKSHLLRKDKSLIWFKKNGIVLVDRNFVPIAKKITTIMPLEVANKFPSIGSISFKLI